MKKLKANKHPNPFTRKILLQLKVNADEMKTILGKAHSYTDGNISAFIRYAALNFKPNKEDFDK